MTGLVRKATLLAACGLVVAGAAMAGVPNAANSQKPCLILADFPNSNQFGGANPGVCAINALKVIVRDALNNPVANSDVVLDFSTCTVGNIKLADTQADPAITTACGGKTVLKTTNALGEVCFSVIGGTNIVDNSTLYPFYTGTPARNIGPSAGQVCGKIYASGNLMDTKLVIVNKYDLTTGAPGNVNAGDGAFHSDAQGAVAGGVGYRTFGDYNCDGTVNAGDGALGLDAQGNNGLSGFPYAGTYCP
jgi:hypothetical protein